MRNTETQLPHSDFKTQIILYASRLICHQYSINIALTIDQSFTDNWHSPYRPSVDQCTGHVSADISVDMLTDIQLSVDQHIFNQYGDHLLINTWPTC